MVNISRNFRSKIDPKQIVELANDKFGFKELEAPSIDYVMDAIDLELLKANWDNQLAHQINDLPSVDSYTLDLKNAITWWLEPTLEENRLSSMPYALGPKVERQLFPDIAPGQSLSTLDRIRRAARTRFLVLVEYKGSQRLVEPYSLRYPTTGKEILHVWEITKDGIISEAHKSFVTDRLKFIDVSNQTFTPKWEIEL